MKIYHYHPETKELLCDGVADQNPLEQGGWLIPAYATNVTPLKVEEGKTIHFDGVSWFYRDIPEPVVVPEKEPVKLTYADLRMREYPDFTDYLDGIVKGDQAQIQAYIDACLAVKAKYPKPIEG